MNRKIVVIGVAAAVASILAACGHDHSDSGSTPPPPPASTSINVSTSELLANYATKPSETASPLPVNGGAFTITDTSDNTAPISVNATN